MVSCETKRQTPKEGNLPQFVGGGSPWSCRSLAAKSWAGEQDNEVQGGSVVETKRDGLVARSNLGNCLAGCSWVADSPWRIAWRCVVWRLLAALAESVLELECDWQDNIIIILS